MADAAAARDTPPADVRTQTALAGVDLAGRGLEIGPSYNPLVPKSSGYDVRVIDHAPREELIAKYRGYGLDEALIERIEEVDHLWSGGSLADVVDAPGTYDYVIASNFIEHTVDLIGFLNDCAAMLRPGGRLALVVPDLRWCFDHFKPPSTLGQIVDAHLRPTTFHPPGSLLDHTAYACTLDGQVAWWPGQTGTIGLQLPALEGAAQVIADGDRQDVYHDTHRWRFTPASFEFLLDDLRDLGYQPFVQVLGGESLGFEFFVTLEAGATPPAARDRLAQLLRVRDEVLIGCGGLTAAEADELRAERSALLGERADLRTELAETRASVSARVTQLEEELDALRASTSWRLTRPLRALRDVTGQVLARVGR
ncbi:class I SAM-dependent methyltransferase [Occultella kanbiaonis]|uniref:class I SAM-dependent methyltransferase n=1 Tax=Occultella kanbiaonis TaxID=2675754 RepID=UPI00143D491F|nr:methyltransferase domain-containing protein [Occultella kanbiaonis]